jgi:formylglycine-generating enzyme required for sulfatase activity
MNLYRKFPLFLSLLLLLYTGCGYSKPAPVLEYSLDFDRRTRQADGMLQVHIPEAQFKVSEHGKGGKGSHQVKLSSFWIDLTEVTNEHYENCVASGFCLAPTSCAWGEPTYNDPAYSDHPVICVTWQMAQSYCIWTGGRLPTEAEWDYAARGPERTLYTWGDKFDPANLNFCDANCDSVEPQYQEINDGYALTSPAGSYPGGASWCGALDMNGNVWEWVADWYAPYTSGIQENPQGPDSGVERIIRGGSWHDKSDFLTADHRHPFDPQDNNHLIGFRCAFPDLESQP